MPADNLFLPEDEVRKVIRQAQDGDPDAFALAVEQVRPFIYGLARQYARRAGGAPIDDLLQIGLLAAVRSVPLFDTEAGVKFVSYAGVAARRAIHRAAFQWRTLPQACSDEADFIHEMADCREPDITRHHADTAFEVQKLVGEHLGDRERHLLGQRFGLDGSPPRTYAEMALVSGTSRQNVQQLVERALRRLRTAMSNSQHS